MIYTSGDTHGDIDLQKLTDFADAHPELTQDDYLIICGDWGVLWDNEPPAWEHNLLQQYESFPWTTLFIDGNHENFQRLNALPVEEWNDGRKMRHRGFWIRLSRR